MAKTTKTTAEAAPWQNRIVGEGEVAAVDLVPHPQNWRKHPAGQGTVLGQTLDGVGWVQRVIVNRRTGRMLDGHLRAELARKQGEQTPVPVVYVDLSEDEERTILATLDPIAGMAIADEATLAGLVRSIEDADLRSVAGTIAQEIGAAPPSGDTWSQSFAGLPDSDRAPFQQMTFTLHDEQAEQVKRAIGLAQQIGDFTGNVNQNSNGNALALICETFVTAHGNG